jgi:prepilin-type N-terminal cleavage/methylation domain-containing protein/prepilin-type processing-associated H-X9-DG protein
MKAALTAPNGDGNLLPRRSSRLDGFSLVELAVTIVVIAIMAALLIPALSKAKLQATAAACLNNQKKLAAAFHLYTLDNADRIVQMADYVTGETFYQAGGFWGGPASGPGWPSAAAALDAAQTGLRTSNGWAFDSYARTQNLGGEPFDNFWGAGGTYTKMSAIFVPGATFSMFEDADWRGYNVGTWVVNWNGSRGFKWQDPPSIWHENVSSVGFADGHAELHKWLDSIVVNAGCSASQGRSQCVWDGPDDGPDYKYVYEGYRFPGHP